MNLLISNDGRVRVLTLNRPEARNALNVALRESLLAALRDAESDDTVGAIVITGEGKCFAAGADLKELAARTTPQQRKFLQPPHIYSAVENLSKPVIAAINGHALGAGLELATACDMRIAAASAKLGQPEINLAIIPGGGGTQRLVRMVGPGQAARLVLTGQAISAQAAAGMGLVDAVVDDAVAEAVAVAAAMAAHDPVSVAAGKRALAAARDLPYRSGLATEIDLFVDLHARDEAKGRFRAFLER